MHFIEDTSAIATALYSNSKLPTFLPQGLTKVERVGMTRNASLPRLLKVIYRFVAIIASLLGDILLLYACSANLNKI